MGGMRSGPLRESAGEATARVAGDPGLGIRLLS